MRKDFKCKHGHDVRYVGVYENNTCKECARVRNPIWKKKNPAKLRKSSKKYRKAHQEQRQEYNKEWRRKYPEAGRKYVRKWQLANPERVRANLAKRNALKRKVIIGSLKAILAIYKRAQWWRRWFDVEVDHIIPLSKGGTHSAKNLQIIYAIENQRKKDRLDYKPRVVFV